VHALAIRDVKKKIAKNLGRPHARGDFFDHATLGRARYRRAGKNIAKLGRIRVKGAKIVELFQDRLGGALRDSDVGERIGVL